MLPIWKYQTQTYAINQNSNPARFRIFGLTGQRIKVSKPKTDKNLPYPLETFRNDILTINRNLFYLW